MYVESFPQLEEVIGENEDWGGGGSDRGGQGENLKNKTSAENGPAALATVAGLYHGDHCVFRTHSLDVTVTF